MQGQKVSDDLNAVLNQIVGDISEETEETNSFLTEQEKAAGFSRCTWVGG